ncbi:MAG: porin [Methylacidiphilales bacterium]|nr:porin [Candidatus Methylacidiphilales bacterium]
MKNILKALSAVALTSTVAFAGEAAKDVKDLKKVIEDHGIYVETDQKGIKLSGYVDTSWTYQFANGKNSRENGAASTENRLRQFDVDHNDFNINAVKLTLEKELPDENKLAAGFRVDLMFGEDAKILAVSDPGLAPIYRDEGGRDNILGDSIYLEQAYVQFRVPVGNGLDFKFGKFVTLLGYEVIESPANLNFSRGLLFTNAIPLTHTGVLASYKFNDTVDAQFGVVNGWNNSDSHADSFAPAITGRLNITAPGGNANIAQSFIYAVDGAPQAYDQALGILLEQNEPTFVYDIWGNWAPKFANDKLLLGFNLVYGRGDHALIDPVAIFGVARREEWYGAALYAKYQFTKVFSLAGRLEWLHSDNSYKIVTQGPIETSSDIYSATITAGFDIWENLLTRLEYRADFGPHDILDASGGSNDGNLGVQHQVAVNFVYSF